MQIVNNFFQAKVALYKYIPTGVGVTRYNLENMTRLMDYLGNPQNRLKIVHVAGTSGKTSTSYFVASLLQKAGYTVGLTISPHIDEINERAQINMLPLTEKEYCFELSNFLNLIETSNLSPSYFEALIAFAYWLFAKRDMEYAVIEVGLGGLMDGTNVISRDDKVCVITDIGLDHTKILGDTVDKIAYQKAGIIQPNNAVFTYRQDEKVMATIEKRCSDMNADLRIIQPDYKNDGFSTSLPLFQKRNLHLAVDVVDYVLGRDFGKTLKNNEIISGSNVYIPGRMEVISYHDKTLILDGSHNEQKIGALVESVLQKYPTDSITLLVSFGENKQSSVLDCLKLLRTISSSIILTSFDLGQDEVRASIKPDTLAVLAKEVGFTDITTEPDPHKALELLIEKTFDIGLITGSFYLLNHVRGVVLK